MNAKSLLAAGTIGLSSLAAGCATDTLEAPHTTPATVGIENKYQPKIEKPDPCAALIKDKDSSLASFYLAWRGHMKDMLKDVKPAPAELHDPSASMCEMVPGDNDTTKIHAFFSGDGQFVGHMIQPNKPDHSFRISLETTVGGIDGNQNPVLGAMSWKDQCGALNIDEWKEWDKMMPLAPDHAPDAVPTSLQDQNWVVFLPCDPTAPAMIGAGGCWHEEPSPENGNQVIDGCGGGGDLVDRNEVTALIQCLQEEMKALAKEMCL